MLRKSNTKTPGHKKAPEYKVAEIVEPPLFQMLGATRHMQVYFHNNAEYEFSIKILQRLLSDNERDVCTELANAGYKGLYVLGGKTAHLSLPHDLLGAIELAGDKIKAAQNLLFSCLLGDIAALATKERHMDNKTLAILYEIVSNSRNKN